MTELTVVLPLPPNMTNDGRLHWSKKRAQQRTYWQLCSIYMNGWRPEGRRAERAPDPPGTSYRASLRFTLAMANPMDDDNALARAKHAVDFLVRQGYVRDDSRKWCSMSVPDQIIERNKAKQRLEITIRYADADPEEGMIVTSLQDYEAKDHG